MPWGYKWLRPYLVCWRRFSKIWTDSGAILSSLPQVPPWRSQFQVELLMKFRPEEWGMKWTKRTKGNSHSFLCSERWLLSASREDFFQSCPLPPPIIQAEFTLPEPPPLNSMQRTALDLHRQSGWGPKGPRAFSSRRSSRAMLPAGRGTAGAT